LPSNYRIGEAKKRNLSKTPSAGAGGGLRTNSLPSSPCKRESSLPFFAVLGRTWMPAVTGMTMHATLRLLKFINNYHQQFRRPHVQ
jgi:hypothetical protein